MKIFTFIFLFSVFLGSISQVMLKKASLKYYSNVFYEYINPLVIAAYILFGATTFLGVIAYRYLPVSFGAILETTSYLYITFFGVTIFKERLTKRKILALLMIIIGIMIYILCG